MKYAISHNWNDDDYRKSEYTWAKDFAKVRQELIDIARKVFKK